MSQQFTYDDIWKMACTVAKAGIYGMTAEQAASLMLIAQAEGRHPGIVPRDYHMIKGRPALKADAMLSRFQEAGGKVKWVENSDLKCVGVFTHPLCESVEINWTIEQAGKAQLTQKKNRDGTPNMWQKFPRQMLRSRVISEGLRTAYPAALVGMYTPEEVEDFEPKKEPLKTDCKDVAQEKQPEPKSDTQESVIQRMKSHIKEVVTGCKDVECIEQAYESFKTQSWWCVQANDYFNSLKNDYFNELKKELTDMAKEQEELDEQLQNNLNKGE